MYVERGGENVVEGGEHFFTPIFNVKFVNRGNIQVGNVRVSISFRAYQVGMTVAVVIV